MLIRPSIQKDLEYIKGIDGGNLIYSMWEGYHKKSSTKKLVDYLLKRKFTLHKIHTSGHADIDTLKNLSMQLSQKILCRFIHFPEVNIRKYLLFQL